LTRSTATPNRSGNADRSNRCSAIRNSLEGLHSRQITSTRDITGQGTSSRPAGISPSSAARSPSLLINCNASHAPPNARVPSTRTADGSTSTHRGSVDPVAPAANNSACRT